MINSVQETAITVLPGENILFASDPVRTASASCCGWLEHEPGSGLFTLTRSGLYEIQFNANITSETTGALTFTINNNGERLTGTEMDFNVYAADVFGNISANRLVRVCGNASKTISVENTSLLDATVENASIIIKKIA